MAHRFESTVRSAVTMTGHVTLTEADIAANTVYDYDPGGAGRNLILPDASEANAGCMVVVHNAADAAEVITVQADSATVVTPTQNESAIVFSTGARWFGIAGADS